MDATTLTSWGRSMLDMATAVARCLAISRLKGEGRCLQCLIFFVRDRTDSATQNAAALLPMC
jgi:hypothetical protein